jgi:hypothetical protein
MKVTTGGRPSHQYEVNPLRIETPGCGVQKVQKPLEEQEEAGAGTSAPFAPSAQGSDFEEETL